MLVRYCIWRDKENRTEIEIGKANDPDLCNRRDVEEPRLNGRHDFKQYFWEHGGDDFVPRNWMNVLMVCLSKECVKN